MLSFYTMVLIIAISCSIITIKTLVGYTSMPIVAKLLISLVVLYSWFAPALNNIIKKGNFLPDNIYPVIYNFGYFMFGLTVILVVLILTRDISWGVAHALKRFLPFNVPPLTDNALLVKANIYTVALMFLIGFYALYEGIREPRIKEITISSPKITTETTIALIADLHVTRGSSPKTIKNIVDKTNSLNADIIGLAGDIIDDVPNLIEAQLEELSKLKAKDGVYVSLGNHEVYRGVMSSMASFKKMGIKLLMNEGIRFPKTNLYFAGTPDYPTSSYSPMLTINMKNTLQNSKEGDYVVALSHSPAFIRTLKNNEIDLQLSGHTHGGQIFPFHFITKRQNAGLLAGLYDVDNMKAYVSRGTRYWGPPMRILAPSEITLIRLKPKQND